MNFTSPVSDGGSPITGYTVTASPGGRTASGTTSPITVTGLTNGTRYTFTVSADNSVGTSVASAASDARHAGRAVNQHHRTAGRNRREPVPHNPFGRRRNHALPRSLAAGNRLPAGLVLTSDGAISGAPTAAGTGSFTAQVTDAANPAGTVTKQLSVTHQKRPRPRLIWRSPPCT